MTRFDQNRRGFTLMELLTVMLIMSILLATGVVSYTGARRGSELRAAATSVQSVISMARQHAVSKRRTTAIVFRREGSGSSTTNCYYVFEKNGVAGGLSSSTKLNVAPLPSGSIDGNLVCNMSEPEDIGSIGTVSRISGNTTALDTKWIDGTGWQVGDSFGFQVNEKQFIPPGVECQVADSNGTLADSGLILFYANGKASGVSAREIKLTDKMSGGAVTRTLTVYPLVGLIKAD